MRWLRRAAIVLQIIGWVDIALLFIGLPGSIDDTRTWARWVALVVSPPILAVAIFFVISGPLLWTSGWWWPRLLQWRRPTQMSPAVLAQPSGDLERFRECLPQVERCQELVSLYAGPLGGYYTWIVSLRCLSVEDNIAILTLTKQLDYLTRSLYPLGIRCPAVYGDKDELPNNFRARMRKWNTHLANLTIMIGHDDLAGARRLMQPTSDKSDALC